MACSRYDSACSPSPWQACSLPTAIQMPWKWPANWTPKSRLFCNRRLAEHDILGTGHNLLPSHAPVSIMKSATAWGVAERSVAQLRMSCSPALGRLPSVSSFGCLETLSAPVALRGIEEEQTLT